MHIVIASLQNSLLNLRATVNKRNVEQRSSFLRPEQDGKTLSLGIILASYTTSTLKMEKAPEVSLY